MWVNDFPDERENNSFAKKKKKEKTDQKRRRGDVQPKNLYFSSVSGASYYKKAVEEVGGVSLNASVFCSVESVEPGEISSHTTPWEAAWWEHCLWLSLSLSLSLIIFIVLALSLMFPLVSHVPSSPPFPPHLCLSLLLSSLRALLRCRPPTEEQGGIFPSALLPLFLPLISQCLSSSSLSSLLSSFFNSLHPHPSINQPPPTPLTHIYP